MMPRLPGYENWPFDHAWAYFPHVPQGKPDAGPGRVRLFHLESTSWWDIHVLAMDALATKHMQDRDSKPGQPVTMADGRTEVIPYRLLDDEADLLLQRGMRPNPDRSPVLVRFVSGQSMRDVPRDWLESLAAGHLARRKAEPPVVLDMGGQAVTLSYECFDALCKDYMRRRGDFVSAGWWPELVDPFRDVGQHKDGPKPVSGVANALGQGVQVLRNEDGRAGPPPQQGQVVHPAVENQDLV